MQEKSRFMRIDDFWPPQLGDIHLVNEFIGQNINTESRPIQLAGLHEQAKPFVGNACRVCLGGSECTATLL
jgi:hypothetical protein